MITVIATILTVIIIIINTIMIFISSIHVVVILSIIVFVSSNNSISLTCLRADFVKRSHPLRRDGTSRNHHHDDQDHDQDTTRHPDPAVAGLRTPVPMLLIGGGPKCYPIYWRHWQFSRLEGSCPVARAARLHIQNPLRVSWENLA